MSSTEPSATPASAPYLDSTIPNSIQTPNSKLVYLYLCGVESATVSEISDALNMKKLAIYSILKILTKGGHAVKERDTVTLA